MVRDGLVVGAVGDRFECDADRFAQEVAGVRSGPTGASQARSEPPAAGTDARARDTGVRQAIAGARGGGRPLPDDVRRAMGAALGADLGRVRVHTDERADRLARALQARAFTCGQDIFLRGGEDTRSPAGRELLAHELAHVVQQAGGSARLAPVAPGPAGVLVQRRMGFEFETTVQVRGTFKGPWAGPNKNASAFDDEEQVYRSGLWKVVTDEGRLEFVTDPLPDLQTVQTVAGQIERFIAGLQNVKRDVDIRPSRNGTWAPARPGRRADYSVHIGSGLHFESEVQPKDWYGQAQVSFGVRTDRVDRFLQRADATAPPTPLASLKARLLQLPAADLPPMPSKGVPTGVNDMAGLVNHWDGRFVVDRTFGGVTPARIPQLVTDHANNLPATQKEKLSGLWRLMAYYWANLSRIKEAGSYRKSALVVMARTDFHSYYQDLDPAAQQAFQAAEDDFVAPGPDTELAGTGITLKRWYRSVHQPEAGSTYSGRAVDLMSANTSDTGDEIATGTDKSMGQYPVEVAGQRKLAVFELRRVTPGIRVPIGMLYTHVLQPLWTFADTVQQ